MDRTGIIVVSICAAMLVVWFLEQPKVAPQPQRLETTNVISATQNPAATATGTTAASAPPAAPAYSFDTNAPEQTLVLTNGRARYTFTSRGGGLKLVEMLDYPEMISARWTKTKTASNAVASLNTGAAVPVLAVLGDTNLVGNGNFTLSRTGNGVLTEKMLANGLTLKKEFR